MSVDAHVGYQFLRDWEECYQYLDMKFKTVDYKIKAFIDNQYPTRLLWRPTLPHYTPLGTLLIPSHISLSLSLCECEWLATSIIFYVWHLCFYGKSLSINHPYPQYALQCQYIYTMRLTIIMT